ncbi:MAG: Uncharacterised protein [Flavobacteriaceae bacterium]|nr:MAG: Uncharacterised protein [Flavobacteriaceae bacterium]
MKVDATKLKGIPAAALEPAGTANYVLTTDASGNAVWAPSGTGPAGPKGDKGADGSSAYQMWIAAGNTGTEAEFLASLVGATGPAGADGKDGKDGTVPTAADVKSTDGSIKGVKAKSALVEMDLEVDATKLKDIPAAAIKQGTNGQVLTTDNTGTTVWATPAAGADDQKLSVTAGAADTSVITLEDGSNITIKLEHPDLVITEDPATRTITIGMRPLKITELKITEGEYTLSADDDILLLNSDIINPILKLPTEIDVPVGKRIYIANRNPLNAAYDMVFEEQPKFLSLTTSTLHQGATTMLVHVGEGRYMTVGHSY